MNRSSTLQVTLPTDLIEFVQSKVASGEFGTESEVIREGIAALQEKDAGFEAWARDVAVPAYDRFLADPSRGIPIQQVRDTIEMRRLKALRQEEQQQIPSG